MFDCGREDGTFTLPVGVTLTIAFNIYLVLVNMIVCQVCLLSYYERQLDEPNEEREMGYFDNCDLDNNGKILDDASNIPSSDGKHGFQVSI